MHGTRSPITNGAINLIVLKVGTDLVEYEVLEGSTKTVRSHHHDLALRVKLISNSDIEEVRLRQYLLAEDPQERKRPTAVSIPFDMGLGPLLV